MENKMVKPDWKLFEFKFSENPQRNFEWFCYLLFCKEFNQSYGIPRLYNQPGIETFPVEYDNEVIGWQAKYFSSKINKDDVLDSVKKAIEKYPKITKLILFLIKNGIQKRMEITQKDVKRFWSFVTPII